MHRLQQSLREIVQDVVPAFRAVKGHPGIFNAVRRFVELGEFILFDTISQSGSICLECTKSGGRKIRERVHAKRYGYELLNPDGVMAG